MPALRALLGVVASRFANRRYVFAIAAVSLIAAKAVHVYTHIAALSTADLMHWGISFFTQDIALLLFLRLILFTTIRALGFLPTLLSAIIVITSATLASINISFFLTTGSELHWRNIGLASDTSSWGVLLTGLFSTSMTLGSILVTSWVLQDLCFVLASVALDVIRFPFNFVYERLPINRHRGGPTPGAKYDHVPQDDVESNGEYTDKTTTDASRESFEDEGKHFVRSRRISTSLAVSLYVSVTAFLLASIFLYAFQPDKTSYSFMSWAVPVLPFMDFAYSSPNLGKVLSSSGNHNSSDIGNLTSLAEPIQLTWLPQLANGSSLAGFEDWYKENTTHYRAENDPLRITNLHDDLLPELKHVLGDIDIRHVLLIKLESTRKDVFPLKHKDIVWTKLEESFENKTLPDDARKRLETLTPTANYITGDYDDGFEHEEQPKRGGINVKNAHTTGTYTLKSLAGTLCGITPLVADFNVEYSNHVYQPCLAQIFDAFNEIDHSKNKKKLDHDHKNYTNFKWRTMFMQSTTGGYDKQDLLMPVLGYKDEKFMQGEYLKSDDAKFGKADLPDVNYYGMPEVALDEYLGDVFASAKKNDERLFLTHLTSTAHHPFGIPDDSGYVKLNEDSDKNDLSSYTNAVGYVDGWLGRVLDILDEQGVANETLVVFVGDHGLSIAENNAVTPYYQPNVGNFHVPLVVSHPHLPPIDISDLVNSIQILPTILDMLLTTGSLSESEAHAATDLIHNYEGQSLIRPMRFEVEETGVGSWQFSVMNTGRAQLAVRDGRRLDWRIVVPIVDNIAWRFTNLENNLHEEKTVEDFDFASFKEKVRESDGDEAAEWVEEAAFVTKWWVDENARRWRYTS